MEINESVAYITCACGERLQALKQTGETEQGELIFDTDHDELNRIAQEHWAVCAGGVSA